MLNKKVLIEYADMKAEIKYLRELIDKTEKKMRKIEDGDLVSDVVSGGMGGKEHFKVTGYPTVEYKRTKDLLFNRKMRLKAKEEELLELTNSAEEFIESIEQSEIRTMFRLYYIEGLTWQQTAMKMNDLFPKRKITYTGENCQKRNRRFFKKI